MACAKETENKVKEANSRRRACERRLAEICSLSPALDKLRVGDNDKEDGNDEMLACRIMFQTMR